MAKGESGFSQAEMIRDSFEKVGMEGKPADYQNYIKNTYNVEIDKQRISQYKSHEKKRLREEGGAPLVMKRRGRKKRTEVGAPAAAAEPKAVKVKAPAATGGSVELRREFIAVLSEWEAKVSVKTIKDVVEFLYG